MFGLDAGITRFNLFPLKNFLQFLTPQLLELFANVAFNVAWGVGTSTGSVKTHIYGIKITKR